MSDALYSDDSVFPLGMKLSQMVSRNSSNKFAHLNGNDFEYAQQNPNSKKTEEDFPALHGVPSPSSNKNFKLKNYTLKPQFSTTYEDIRNNDGSKQYMPLFDSMKQKTSLTYQHLCGSNKNRLTKKSSAYHQLHLLSKSKQDTEQKLDNFVRLYGSNSQQEGIVKENENRLVDTFRFSPQLVENVSESKTFNIDELENAVDSYEPETFTSEYFSPPLERVEEGVKQNFSRYLVETCHHRNVPSVDDLLHRECYPNGPSEQNMQFQKRSSTYEGNNCSIDENYWQEDVDELVQIRSSNLNPSVKMRNSEKRYSDLYSMSDSPSPRLYSVSETSYEDIDYECVSHNTKKSSRERTPKEKVMFPFVSFPEKDGTTIVIQEMLPTY